MTARERLPNRRTAEPRPIFTLRIEGQPGRASIHALKALLKTLLRRHHFKCLDLREDRGKR
jgi:hypothetical protein